MKFVGIKKDILKMFFLVVNSEDLDLVDMLEDMDEKPVEEDSVMGTPADDKDADNESDDAEYSQVYNDETVIMDLEYKRYT